jgi:hypothetical protein
VNPFLQASMLQAEKMQQVTSLLLSKVHGPAGQAGTSFFVLGGQTALASSLSPTTLTAPTSVCSPTIQQLQQQHWALLWRLSRRLWLQTHRNNRNLPPLRRPRRAIQTAEFVGKDPLPPTTAIVGERVIGVGNTMATGTTETTGTTGTTGTSGTTGTTRTITETTGTTTPVGRNIRPTDLRKRGGRRRTTGGIPVSTSDFGRSFGLRSGTKDGSADGLPHYPGSGWALIDAVYGPLQHASRPPDIVEDVNCQPFLETATGGVG